MVSPGRGTGACGGTVQPREYVLPRRRRAEGCYQGCGVVSKGRSAGDCRSTEQPGGMYNKGKGVPRDNALAHMWATLAAEQGNENPVKRLELLEKEMPPKQIAEAQRLAREWRPKSAE